MIDMKNLRAHTILFTEDCPLNCRYCQLKLESDYLVYKGQSFEKILEKVKMYDEQDEKDGVNTQLTFTGGEPFLYWDWIKRIIEIYGQKFVYHFNTCGYCFTEEILEFLSHYNTHFTLSIDGGEQLTNYIRPVKGTKYHTGYYKKIKEISPILTYYFPQVECKVIINNRYVDLLYDIYLDMEKLGFQQINFILDFNARPQVEGTKKHIQRLWDDNDTKILKEQFDLLVKEILLRFSYNKKFMRISNIDKIIQFLLLDIKEYSPDNLVCNVFKGRTLETLQNEKERHCFEGHYDKLEDAYFALIEEYNKTNGICPLDSSCPAFLYCANNNCPISSYQCTGNFFGCDTLECIISKISYEAAIKILTIANDICTDSSSYKNYINYFNYPGKEEYYNDILSFK